MAHGPATSHGLKLRQMIFFLALSTALAFMLACSGQPTLHRTAKVNKLLNKMSLVEKIRMIHGEKESPATYQGHAGYLAGNPRLGIAGLRLADGPPGVLTRHPSTAPTATMGLAATFSPADARLNGVVIGRDAHALGIDVALQPFINIFRDPTWRRSYILYGEDPLLVGEMGAALVRGIQSQGVMAQTKHFVAINGGDNVVVGQQALHEIYTASFAAVVKVGVSSIMCSYNQVNGAYACGNSQTLRKLLKEEIGFKGPITSDWGATHATNFVNNGLDVEMPGREFPFPPAISVPRSRRLRLYSRAKPKPCFLPRIFQRNRRNPPTSAHLFI
jgi:beta-glucosidase